MNGDMFITEARNGDVDLGRPIRLGFGLGELHRPARVTVLLAEFGGLVLQVRRDPACLDLGSLRLGVAPLGCGHQRASTI